MKNKNIMFLILVLICTLFLGGCSSETPNMESAVKEVQKKLIGDKTLEVESVSEEKYAYQTLNDQQKKVYDEIVYTIQNRGTKTQIATTDLADMELAYQAVRYDYCEFFWVEQLTYVTYTRDDEVTAIEISPAYSMSKEEQKQIQEQIDEEVSRILTGAPVDGSDFDKALYVYETLIREVDYVENSADNQNIISVFVNKETICQGYAYGTQYLLERLGIPCTTVTGDAEGEKHAWNLVQLDGDYYYIDTTWGNSQYMYRKDRDELAQELAHVRYLDYDYFGATTETILATHTPDPQIPLPECTAVEDNYFIHEGLYVEVWDEEQIGAMMRDAYDAGLLSVQIKFANTELWEQAMQYFVEDSHVFDYCQGIETIQYLENADTSVLALLFPENSKKEIPTDG